MWECVCKCLWVWTCIATTWGIIPSIIPLASNGENSTSPTTSETVVHSGQHYPQVWPHLPSLQGIVLHFLSTQVSSNTRIFPRMHKAVIIMTWVHHNNTIMNTDRVPPLVCPLEYFQDVQVIIAENMSTWGPELRIYSHGVCTYWSFLGMMIIPTVFWPSHSILLAMRTVWDFQPWRLGDNCMEPSAELEQLHMNLNSEHS